MSEFIRRLHYGTRRRLDLSLVRLLLWPVSLIYGLVVKVRRSSYRAGSLKGAAPECPTISIGNLTTGGTGKTPIVMMIAEALTAQGKRVGILSRGYRSKAESRGIVFEAETATQANLDKVGDEVAMMAAKLPRCIFGVGRDRSANARRLVSDYGVDCLILDDGFQHLRLKRDLDIVAIDAGAEFGNGMLLPSGPLREPISALRFADVVLLTRTEDVPLDLLQKLQRRIESFVAKESIFRLRTQIASVSDFVTRQPVVWESKRLWLFSGIGNPYAFSSLVHFSGGGIFGHSIFPDHHPFTGSQTEVLRSMLTDKKIDLLLMTEKDAARLPAEAFRPGECGVVEIGLEFAERSDIFWGIVARCVSAQV